MLFSKNANLVLVPVERTGSQAIEAALNTVLPDLNRTSKYSRHCLSVDDFNYIRTESTDLDSLRIVITARNPVSRMMSCYNKRLRVHAANKGESVASIMWGYGRFWNTFPEFVQWHVDTKDTPIEHPSDYLDWHLQTPGKRLNTGEPMTDFRQLIPQGYSFNRAISEFGRQPDFIIRQESLTDDLAKISDLAASITVGQVDATESNHDELYFEGLEDKIREWQSDEFSSGGYE